MFAAINATAERVKAEKWRAYEASRVDGLHWWQTDEARDEWRTFARSAQSTVERQAFGVLLIRRVVRAQVPATPVQRDLAARAAVTPIYGQSFAMRRAIVLWSAMPDHRVCTSAFFEAQGDTLTITTHGYALKPERQRVPLIAFHNAYNAGEYAGGAAARGRGRAERAQPVVRSLPRGRLWRDGKLVDDSA